MEGGGSGGGTALPLRWWGPPEGLPVVLAALLEALRWAPQGPGSGAAGVGGRRPSLLSCSIAPIAPTPNPLDPHA